MRLKQLLALGALALGALLARLAADPLSRRTEIDFFRDVPSRNLKGVAARSDGRLVAGPALTDLAGDAPADLLWCLAPTARPDQWLVGTGPDGKIFELTIDGAKSSYASREVARLPEDSHIFALLRLTDGAILAGTSPKGALCLVRPGQPLVRVTLPADSVLDLLQLTDGTVLAATGNPGRIYRIDLKSFAAATAPKAAAPERKDKKLSETEALAARGITRLGEIRDRNIRRLARLPDGRIAAGSAPRGNVYAFPAAGGDPVLLLENRDAEVTDLLAQPDGSLLAALTYAGTTTESRLTPPAKNAKSPDTPPPAAPAAPERFSGRAAVMLLPANGFPETLSARNSTAFYALGRVGDVVIAAGGEQGELVGFDVKQRLSLTYAGSNSSQLTTLAPVSGRAGQFIALRNNAPGLALLDFNPAGPRSAETRRLDLGTPAELGALRLSRLREVAPAALAVDFRVSQGSDEIEGWGPWTAATTHADGWRVPGALRGRYAKFRFTLPAAGNFQLGKADLFLLPQDRRPQLQEFRVLPPGYAVLPAAEPTASPVTTVGQLLQSAPKSDEEKRKPGFLSSQVVPSPGSQAVYWNLTDPDGDSLTCTFSIRHENSAEWTDIAVDSRDPFAQFDTARLGEGTYFTRLVATETAPRPVGDRLTVTFETDDLVVDHSPPEILAATLRREGGQLILSVRGRDALSLLAGLEAVLNNGVRDEIEQPLDGIRDGREETFELSLPLARAAGATSVEMTLYDQAGNAASRRLPITP